MKETKRKKITPLGWVTFAILLISFIASLVFVWSPVTDFFTKMGIAPFLSSIVSFIIIYSVLVGVTLAVIKLGEKKLFCERGEKNL